MVCGLSIPLALFSTWLAGYISLVCERAYIQAYIETFDEHWQAPKGHRSYQWFRYLAKVPSVLTVPDGEVYREEKFRDREERVNAFIERSVQSANHLTATTFGLLAAVLAVVSIKLYTLKVQMFP